MLIRQGVYISLRIRSLSIYPLHVAFQSGFDHGKVGVNA